MTTVFDQSAALAGTTGGSGNDGICFRVVLSPSVLAAASGTQCQLTFLWGTTETSETGAVTTVYFGQAGASDPNFAGDQVQVKFGGNAGFDGSAAGVVTSDVFTLAQSFDATKKYVVAFHFLHTGALHGTGATATVTGCDVWLNAGGATADSSSQTTPPGMSLGGSNSAFFLEKATVTASGGGPALAGATQLVMM